MSLGGFKLDTNGRTLTVTVTGAGGSAPTCYTTSAGTVTRALPATISSDTAFYFAGPDELTISVKTSGGVEVASSAGGTVPFSVRDGQFSGLAPTVDLAEEELAVGVPPGTVIDEAIITTSFDVKAVATTKTTIPGAMIYVPTGVTSDWRVEFDCDTAALITGTAAAFSGVQIEVFLYEVNTVTGALTAYGYGAFSATAPTTTTKTYLSGLRIRKRFDATPATPRTFLLQAATKAAIPASWGTAQLYGEDTPLVAGAFASPMSFRAVTV